MHKTVKGGMVILSLAVWGADALAQEPAPSYLINASFDTVGYYGDSGAPAYWDLAGAGGVTLWRDTVDFHSAPAAIKIVADGDTADGMASQQMYPVPKGTVTLSGWYKTTGTFGPATSAQMVLHAAKGPGWTEIGWFTAYRVEEATNEWREFSGSAEIPDTATMVIVRLYVERGLCTLWVDDLRVTVTESGTRRMPALRHGSAGYTVAGGRLVRTDDGEGMTWRAYSLLGRDLREQAHGRLPVSGAGANYAIVRLRARQGEAALPCLLLGR